MDLFFFPLFEIAVPVSFQLKVCSLMADVVCIAPPALQSVSVIPEFLKAELGMAMQMHDRPLSCLYQSLFTARPFHFPIPPRAS